MLKVGAQAGRAVAIDDPELPGVAGEHAEKTIPGSSGGRGIFMETAKLPGFRGAQYTYPCRAEDAHCQ